MTRGYKGMNIRKYPANAGNVGGKRTASGCLLYTSDAADEL